MNRASDDETGLTTGDAAQLMRLTGIMIPGDPSHGVPGADDPAIFHDILASLGRDMQEVRAVLTQLASGGFAELDDAAAEALAMRLLAEPTRAVLALGRIVLGAYYRDDRVMRALGREPRPPFPQGHALPEGNWTLLDAVKARAPLWRDDRVA